MARVRADYSHIKGLIAQKGLSEETMVVVALPLGGLQIIESIMGQRMLWRASYRGADDMGDVEWSKIVDISERTVSRMSEYIELQQLYDVLTSIDNRLTKLDNIGDTITYSKGCCGDEMIPFGDIPIYDTGNNPPVWGGVQTQDWDEYDALVCGACMLIIQHLANSIREIHQLKEDGNLILLGVAGIMAILSSPAWGLLLAADWIGAADLFSELASSVIGDGLLSMADTIDANLQELADSIFCKRELGVTQATENLYMVAGNYLNATELSIFKLFPLENSVGLAFSGTNIEGTDLELSPSQSCSECETPVCELWQIPEGWNCQISTLTKTGGAGTNNGVTELSGGWWEVNTGEGGSSNWVEFSPDVLTANPPPANRAVIMECVSISSEQPTLYSYSPTFHTSSSHLGNSPTIFMFSGENLDLQEWWDNVAPTLWENRISDNRRNTGTIISPWSSSNPNRLFHCRIVVLWKP